MTDPFPGSSGVPPLAPAPADPNPDDTADATTLRDKVRSFLDDLTGLTAAQKVAAAIKFVTAYLAARVAGNHPLLDRIQARLQAGFDEQGNPYTPSGPPPADPTPPTPAPPTPPVPPKPGR